MSFQAMTWAVKQRVGNATGKAILLTLANYADANGECYPSQETLAGDCECSKRSVLEWLGNFEGAGLLSRERRTGEGGYRRSDIIRLSLHAEFSRENISRENNSEPTRSTFTAEPVREPTSSLRSDVKREPNQFDELAKVLDDDHAQAVVDHRKTFRARFTPYAARLLARKFAQCPDPNAAADAMICNGWQGFDPSWLDKKLPRGSPRQSVPELSELFAMAGERVSDERPAENFPGTRQALPNLSLVRSGRNGG